MLISVVVVIIIIVPQVACLFSEHVGRGSILSCSTAFCDELVLAHLVVSSEGTGSLLTEVGDFLRVKKKPKVRFAFGEE